MKFQPSSTVLGLLTLLAAGQLAAAGEPGAAPAKIMNTEELKKKLTPIQYNVCILSMTEPAFSNEYWDNHERGLYVDVIDGTALFASTTKFDSGTGWPSFFQPIDKESVEEITDRSHGMIRVEVRAKKTGAHLGHVFDDGPKPTGKRYCINSASLRFIPEGELKEAGYEKYRAFFPAK